jgi:hypothetical protein
MGFDNGFPRNRDLTLMIAEICAGSGHGNILNFSVTA